MSPLWWRVLLVAAAVAAGIGAFTAGTGIGRALGSALVAGVAVVVVALTGVLAARAGRWARRFVAGRRPTLRSVLIPGGALLALATVGLLAFNTYAILTGEGSGSPSPQGSEPAPSAPLSPEAQGTPACPPQQVYMPGLRRCVPASLSCAEGERYDTLRERCVPDVGVGEELGIPEPAEPIREESARPTFTEQRCQEAQGDLTDAMAELAERQVDLVECRSRPRIEVCPSEDGERPQRGCSPATEDACGYEEGRVLSAGREVESARSSIRIWCSFP